MVLIAKRLEVAGVESGSSVYQSNDVIHFRGRLCNPFLQAVLTERVLLQVAVPELVPRPVVSTLRGARSVILAGLASEEGSRVLLASSILASRQLWAGCVRTGFFKAR